MRVTTASAPVGRAQRGLSIVELLVGIAIGLFVLAGATMVASNQIADNKRLLLETQVQQDLRTAMDVIVRDVRRSGFSAFADVLPPVGVPVAAEPDRYRSAGAFSASNALLYTYDAQNPSNPTADALDFRGFKLNSGTVEVQLGDGNWQALTDPGVVTVTAFSATPVVVDTVNLPPCAATGPCATPSVNGCGAPRVISRYIDISMTGQASHDASVVRRLDSRVKVRNDEVCL